MDEYKIQEDLFEEARLPGGIKGIRRLIRQYPQRTFLSYIRIPVEYIVIGAIAVLLLLIVAYAVGVERGKNIAKKDFEKTNDVNEEPRKIEKAVQEETVLREPVEESRDKRAEKADIQIEEFYVSEETSEVSEENPADATSLDKTAYILQLASFKNKSSADKEIEKLRNKGFSGTLSKSGAWYKVYLDGFSTLDEAEDAKKTLSEDYKDSYIRRIR